VTLWEALELHKGCGHAAVQVSAEATRLALILRSRDRDDLVEVPQLQCEEARLGHRPNRQGDFFLGHGLIANRASQEVMRLSLERSKPKF
jgi:hypothetical protein